MWYSTMVPTVGCPPTVGLSTDLPGVARAVGNVHTYSVSSKEELVDVLNIVKNQPGLTLLEVKVKKGNRKNLGRPTTTLIQNKEALMDFLKEQTMQMIYHGIEHLQEAVAGSKRILLVVDKSFSFLNIRKEIEAISVPYVKFDQFTSNPLYEDVCKGVELFGREGCDTILAVGGGSTIDVAKCIKLYCKMPKDRLFLEQDYKDTGVRLIAVPTTAGTGSESTRYAVIYYDGKKQSVTHDSIVPDYAILEPVVLKTLPMYQKKCTMLDALCQGIESWWSVNSTDESRLLSKMAVETITAWWREYIFSITDVAAVEIMKAANLAGRAISITQTTAPHAFSYKLTSLYHLPHGHAVAVCLPVIWEFMTEHPELCIDDRGQAYLQQIFADIAHAMGLADAKGAIVCFRDVLRECQMEYPRSHNPEDDIRVLTQSVNPVRLSNNPVRLDEETISTLYASILNVD